MFEILFTTVSLIKAILYYGFLFSWKTGKLIITTGNLLLTWFYGIAEHLFATLKVFLEDFQPFAADILGYIKAIFSVLSFLTSRCVYCFHSVYCGVSAVVNGVISTIVQIYIELNNAISSVIGGVVELFTLIKRFLILFGSGVWFLLTLIPLFFVSCFIYSTYCLGLVFEEVRNLFLMFIARIKCIYEFVIDVPVESLAGLIVAICLVYIFVQFHIELYHFFRDKLRVFIEIIRRNVVSFRLTFHRNTLIQESDEEDNNQRESVSDENCCIICHEHTKSVLLLPCKHVCLCNFCVTKLNRFGSKCPVCRSHVHRTMKVFI